MGDREEFLQIFQQHVTRPGSEKLLDWLDNKTDFFSAPASTRFHGACEGGLCMHSLNGHDIELLPLFDGVIMPVGVFYLYAGRTHFFSAR